MFATYLLKQTLGGFHHKSNNIPNLFFNIKISVLCFLLTLKEKSERNTLLKKYGNKNLIIFDSKEKIYKTFVPCPFQFFSFTK